MMMASPRITDAIRIATAVLWSVSSSCRIENGDSFTIAQNAIPNTITPKIV